MKNRGILMTRLYFVNRYEGDSVGRYRRYRRAHFE
jgi:hypothetical protein